MHLTWSKCLAMCSLVACFQAMATTYYPLPIDKQLNESKAVIKGEYQGATYKKTSTGEIVTVASFKIEDSVGLKQNEMLNKNDFKVIFPGGKWNKMVYTIDGAPQFSQGESSVLILNKSPYGFVLNGLSLGKYEIVKKDGQLGLMSSVFPDHPKLGFIALDSFNTSLNDRFGSKLTSLTHDKAFSLTLASNVRMPASAGANFESVRGTRRGRSPASSRAPAYHAATESISSFWLVLLFAVMGLYPVFFIKKKDI